MAATVVARNVLKIKATSAETAQLILQGHLIHDADVDEMALTTTSYLQVSSQGHA